MNASTLANDSNSAEFFFRHENGSSAAASASAQDFGVFADDDHLYQFGPVELLFWFSVYTIVAVLSVLGNVLVIYVIVTRPRMQNVPNYFVANLAAVDAITGLIVVPFKFQAALLQQWLLPAFMCFLIPCIETLVLGVSVFIMTATTVDRLRIFFKPNAMMSAPTAKLVLVFIWVLSIGLSIPYGIGHNLSDEFIPNVTVCYSIYGNTVWWRAYNIYLTIIQYFVPLPIINGVYCYIGYNIFIAAKSPSNSARCEHPSEAEEKVLQESSVCISITTPDDLCTTQLPVSTANTPCEDNDPLEILFEQEKKRIMNLIMIVIIVFTFSWLPYETYLILCEVWPEINEYYYINIVFFVFHWLAMSNSCVNPILYFFFNKKFQREYIRVFRRLAKRMVIQKQSIREALIAAGYRKPSIELATLKKLSTTHRVALVSAGDMAMTVADRAAAANDDLARRPSAIERRRLSRRQSCRAFVVAELGLVDD